MSTTPIPAGSLAKITQDFRDDENSRSRKKGDLIEIEDYVSAEEAEYGVAFYWASSHGTGNMNDVCVEADHVELVKTPEEMNARRIPTMEELRAFLGSELLGDAPTFDVTETDHDGNGVEIAGTTRDGLRFVATIQITSIYEADF